MSGAMRTDLHQHLLPEPLIGALARRSAAPQVVGSGPPLRLELAAEPLSALQERDHDPVARAAEAEREGIDRIVVSLSTALGIEALQADEARPLVDAFNHGVLELGGPFELWGTALTADDVDALLDAGARGITLPAPALVDGRAEALLARLPGGGGGGGRGPARPPRAARRAALRPSRPRHERPRRAELVAGDDRLR